jgi:F0F1-type ATP synthase assembly protein I
MLNDLETRPDIRILELVGGIATDVRVLVKQHLALIRHEVKGEITHAKRGGSLMAVGLSIALTGGVLLGAMLVHLLAQLAPSIPLWGCYGIVAAPFLACGVIVYLAGMRLFGFDSLAIIDPGRDSEENIYG